MTRTYWNGCGWGGSILDADFSAGGGSLLHADFHACAACNGVKRDRLVPDATTVITAQNVWVSADGVIHANTPEAAKLIELLGLDSQQSTEFRMLWLGIIALADAADPELFQRLMGFPANLPDLARLRPPDGNVRPDGIHESYFAKRRNGVLAATY